MDDRGGIDRKICTDQRMRDRVNERVTNQEKKNRREGNTEETWFASVYVLFMSSKKRANEPKRSRKGYPFFVLSFGFIIILAYGRGWGMVMAKRESCVVWNQRKCHQTTHCRALSPRPSCAKPDDDRRCKFAPTLGQSFLCDTRRKNEKSG